MDSVFDQIMDEDHNMLIQKIEEVTTELEKGFKMRMDAYRRYTQSGDTSEIINYVDKENISVNTATAKKPTRFARKPLTDSNESLSTEASNVEDLQVKIKIEKQVMPAPSTLPLKKRVKREPVENKDELLPKRSTRSKTNPQNKQNKDQRYNSDIIIQEQPIPTVYVRDSEFENEAGRTRQAKLEGTFSVPCKNEMVEEPLPTRSTRTKTLRKNKAKETEETKNMDVEAKQSDENRIPSEEVPDSDNEAAGSGQIRSKRNANTLKDGNTKLDGTFVAPKVKTEKEEKPLPTRSTRTKTLRKNNVEEMGAKKIDELATETAISKEAEKPNLADATYVAGTDETAIADKRKSTPVADRTFVLEKPVVKKDITKQVPVTKVPEIKLKKNEVFSPFKKTPLKDKVAAFEKLKNTPVNETNNKTPSALQRKGTILKAQSEEVKKKREFKQQRAQQLRDNLAKDKLKSVEKLKKKDENLNGILREIPKKQANSCFQANVMNKLKVYQPENSSKGQGSTVVCPSAIKKPNKIPMYMTTNMPRLPTDDCYDSDEESCRKMIRKPAWAQEESLKRTLKTMACIGESVKNSFFCRTTYSPDLLDIFEYVHPTKLKRNSSAVWREPPRYTLFSVTRDIQFSDDDDE